MMTAREAQEIRDRLDGSRIPNTSGKKMPATAGSKTQRRAASLDDHRAGVRKPKSERA